MQRIVYPLTLLILMTLARSLLSRPAPLPMPGDQAPITAPCAPRTTHAGSRGRWCMGSASSGGGGRCGAWFQGGCGWSWAGGWP